MCFQRIMKTTFSKKIGEPLVSLSAGTQAPPRARGSGVIRCLLRLLRSASIDGAVLRRSLLRIGGLRLVRELLIECCGFGLWFCSVQLVPNRLVVQQMIDDVLAANADLHCDGIGQSHQRRHEKERLAKLY